MDECFLCADGKPWCKIRYLDHTERGLGDTVETEQIMPAVRAQASGPTHRDLWLTVEQLGEYQMAVGSGLPRSVQTFWEEEQRQQRHIPEGIRGALRAREEQLARNPAAGWEQQEMP